MTFYSFIARTQRVAASLRQQGLSTDIASIIWWNREWHDKWARALLEGVYDA